jgi:putative ABC transport system permease protein
MFSDFLFRLRALFRPKAMDAELDDELKFHLERQCEKHIQSGLAPSVALRRARLELGGAAQVAEECREARGIRALETTWQDVRYAVRTLRKIPAFTCVALLTVALGIGANTAMFSVVHGVLLRPLPYSDPDRLIVLNETTPRIGTVSVSYLNFLDWRAQSRSFSEMAVVTGTGFNLGAIAQPEAVSAQAVSSRFLPMIGVHPILGRHFGASEDNPGAAPVAMLSYPLWQSHFGGDQKVIGRSISLDGRGFTIIAVLPPGFRSTGEFDLLVPLSVWFAGNDAVMDRGNRGGATVVARLASGVTLQSARAEMQGIAARLAAAYPDTNQSFGVILQPIRELFAGDARASILIVFGASVFVLLIACANLANLCLMRSAGRSREFALRISLGATRGRVVRQMLAESLVLAVFGGSLGLGLAAAAIQAVPRFIPAVALGRGAVEINASVLSFAAVATVLVAVGFGLAPALQSARSGLQARLSEGSRSTTSGVRQQRWRSALVIVEIALSVILLAGAGLMLRSLHQLLSVDSGFQPDRLLKVAMGLSGPAYEQSASLRRGFWRRVLEGVHALPGVESAAFGTLIPLTNQHARNDITIEGMPIPSPGNFPHPDVHAVSAGYVRTLGLRLVRGREFTDSDSETSPSVAMINQRLAREFFPGEDPIGKRFIFGRPAPAEKPRWFTIVGVVADTRLYGLDNPSRLEVYRAFAQRTPDEGTLVVKSRLDPAALTSSIRAVVASVDRDQPISSVATMNQVVQDSFGSRRVTLILLGLFSALALILAAIGIYGVIAYSVANRTQEIGIRMALGAGREAVLGMIVFQGARIAAAGVVTGMIIAFGLTRYLETLLFSVSPSDPITFAAVGIILAVVAVLASYIPARRALRIDPVVALRFE